MATDEKKEGGPWYPDWERTRPVGGVVLTMLAIIAWLVFIMLYALYWSGGFSFFQNIIVTIATLMITGLVIGIGWVVWGFRHVKRWKKPE
jgi:hypothetical protein